MKQARIMSKNALGATPARPVTALLTPGVPWPVLAAFLDAAALDSAETRLAYHHAAATPTTSRSRAARRRAGSADLRC